MANVKGTTWTSIRDYLLGRFGENSIDVVKAELEPRDREILSMPILPSTWFDYGTYIRFCLTADVVLGKGDGSMLREASAFHARNDLNGVYRIFISLVSPDTVIKNVAKLWGRYLDCGVATIETRNEKGGVVKGGVLKISDFPDMPPRHELEQLPFMEECLRMSACTGVRGSHPKCISRGDDSCIYEFSWH